MGLFGAGRIGKMHGGILAALDEVDEIVIADPDDAAAGDLAVQLEATSLPVADAVASVDAMVIAAASDAHAPLTRAGLERGLPVFCEKPLAPALDDAIELARDIESSGVPFQLGFQRRFDPGYAEARRMVDSGDLGTLYCIRMAGHDPEPPHESYIPVSGGLFRDFSGHDFDILRWLTGGEVEEVYADGAVRGFPVFAKYDDVDTATAMLRLETGVLAVMTIARHDPLGYDIRTELFGSRDSISVGMGPRQPIRSVEPGVPPPAGPAWPGFAERFADAYHAELKGFLALARSEGEGESACTARDGVEAGRIAEATTLSRLEHRPVRLDEIPN